MVNSNAFHFPKMKIKYKHEIKKQEYYFSFDIKYCENIVEVNIFLHEAKLKNRSKVLLQTKYNKIC